MLWNKVIFKEKYANIIFAKILLNFDSSGATATRVILVLIIVLVVGILKVKHQYNTIGKKISIQQLQQENN